MEKGLGIILTIITTVASLCGIAGFALQYPQIYHLVVAWAVLAGEVTLALGLVTGLIAFFASRPEIFFLLLRLVFQGIVVVGAIAATVIAVSTVTDRTSREHLELLFSGATLVGVIWGWFASSLVLRMFDRGLAVSRH